MCIFKRKKGLLNHRLHVKAMKKACKEQTKLMKGKKSMGCGGRKKRK